MADVATPRPEWEEDETERALPLALKEGIRALKRDAGIFEHGQIVTSHTDVTAASSGTRAPGLRRWLWPNPGEEDLVEQAGTLGETRFQKRMRRLRMNNVFKMSLAGAASMPWRNPVQATGWGPTEDIFGDVTGQGQTLTDFGRTASIAKFFAGIHFGLVELDEDVSAAVRPYWVHVPASAWRHWTWTVEGGRVRLLEAKIEMAPADFDVPEDPNSFDPAEEAPRAIQVYRAGNPRADAGSLERKYRVMRYERADGGEWAEAWEDWRTPGRGVLSDIPAVPFYSSWEEPFRSPPMFVDPAFSELELVRKRSELDDLERKAKEPFLLVTGAAPTKTDSGSTDMGDVFYLHSPDADGKMIQLDASNIQLLSEEIDKGEAAVRLACLDPMMGQPTGRTTATEIGFREMRVSSWLEASARSDIGSLNQMAIYTALLVGAETAAREGTLTLPTSSLEVFSTKDGLRDFFKELAALGLMSREGMWEQLKDLEVGVPDDFNVAEEAKRLKSEQVTDTGA